MNFNKIKLTTILLLFVSTMDWPNLNILGSTVRFGWALLPFLLIPSLYILKLNKIISIYLIFFAISSIITFLYSYNINKSLFYILWIFVNYLTFFTLIYSVSKINYEVTINSILIISRLNICISLIFYAIGFQDRPSAFLYETSYLSISLIPYYASLFFSIGKVNKFDYILGLLFIIFSQSAALLLYISLYPIFFVVRYFVNKNFKIIDILKFIIISFVLFSFFSFYLNNVDDINTRVIIVFLDNISFDALGDLAMRGGNRIPRLLEAVNVIRDNWSYGVGVGAYENYLSIHGLSDQSANLEDYLSPDNQPAVNIWLEIFATNGIVGFLIFSSFTLFIFSSCFNFIKDKNLKWYLLYSSLSIFLVMNFEANYMRAYLWCFVGLIMGIINKNGSINNNINANT